MNPFLNTKCHNNVIVTIELAHSLYKPFLIITWHYLFFPLKYSWALMIQIKSQVKTGSSESYRYMHSWVFQPLPLNSSYFMLNYIILIVLGRCSVQYIIGEAYLMWYLNIWQFFQIRVVNLENEIYLIMPVMVAKMLIKKSLFRSFFLTLHCIVVNMI